MAPCMPCEMTRSTAPSMKNNSTSKDSSRMCRFCLCTESEEVHQDEHLDEFVSPCPCRGSGRFVHIGCLVQHFTARGDWHNFECPTCKQVYDGKALQYLAQISAAKMIKQHGKDSLEVAFSLCFVAQSKRQLGNIKQSKTFFERSLQIQEQHLGKNHIDTAATLTELASTCGRLGEVQSQKELLERSLVITEKHYGEGHISTAATLLCLAVAYTELGDVMQQREMLERSLAIREQHFGRNHVQCVATLTNLASVYSELGDTHRCRHVLEETLTIEEKHFGPGHVETATTLNNLALACGETGDLQSMKQNLERSLDIKEAYYGFGHPETCLTLANLGVACSVLGETALARECTHRAHMACKMEDSASSRRHIMVFQCSAITHKALGEASEAEEFASLALQHALELLGPASAARTLKREISRSSRIWSIAGRHDMLKWLEMLRSLCTKI